MLRRIGVTTAIAAAIGMLASFAGQPGLTGPAASSRLSDNVASISPSVAPVDLEGQSLPELAGAGWNDGWGDAERAADPMERRTVALGRGDSLMEVLTEASVERTEAHGAIQALKGVYNPARLKAGQEITVLFDRTEGEGRFVGFEFQPEVERAVSVSYNGSRYHATEVAKPLQRRLVAARAQIRSSLSEAGAQAGIPYTVLKKVIDTYAYQVDFQRSIQPGDQVELLFERYFTEEGEAAKDGEVLYASLTISGKKLQLYRFETESGSEFFNRLGESIRKALLTTPIDGARLTSGFGMRRHPVLGYSKMHKGVDFAAPTGTPVYAAGAGTIVEIGQKGAYGNYVRIRHNNEISTAYAHLSRFGKTARPGARVAQGDIIGYVGTTGRSTGPHLHYEILQGNKQVNPQSVKMPTGRTLAGKELKEFQARVAQLDREFEQSLPGGVALVSAPGDLAVTPAKACAGPKGC
ncbi:MAG TPA: peptidoglycan DD-metalloendopeptidase family protein [Azospirillaceae bacterium]|nr:peptidoglycan DD-metalloendopeptidase family protein [Azospirillaceae bacterium]